MVEPLNIALAGLGTVGTGVVRLIETNAELIARRARRPIRIAAVSARDRTKDRGVDLSRYDWEDDPAALAARSDVDVVVEMVGGSDGPALALARGAIGQGKGLVTANKAMIAHHGLELASAAEKAGVALKFEAAVAGGIPVIKGLSEGAAANAIERVYGILNGTCNYILSTMEDTGRDFGDVLAEAQRMGYAEADPTFDVEGIDAAHKLSILAAIAFGSRLRFDAVETTGISRVKAADIEQARSLGYVIRLLGMSEIDRTDGTASIRTSCPSTTRSLMSTAQPMRSWPKATSWAACCFRGQAPVTGRPPARSWPISSISRAARKARPSRCRKANWKRWNRPRPAIAAAAATSASPCPTVRVCWPRSLPPCATRESRSPA